jgi:leucyl-tRNA synthetase
LVIQVNGKVRDKAEVEVEIENDRLKDLVLSREIVKKWLAGKPVKSFIVVPNKLVNIVI